jgi:hypothetical protein
MKGPWGGARARARRLVGRRALAPKPANPEGGGVRRCSAAFGGVRSRWGLRRPARVSSRPPAAKKPPRFGGHKPIYFEKNEFVI